jgi:hypothetical protein
MPKKSVWPQFAYPTYYVREIIDIIESEMCRSPALKMGDSKRRAEPLGKAGKILLADPKAEGSRLPMVRGGDNLKLTHIYARKSSLCTRDVSTPPIGFMGAMIRNLIN